MRDDTQQTRFDMWWGEWVFWFNRTMWVLGVVFSIQFFSPNIKEFYQAAFKTNERDLGDVVAVDLGEETRKSRR